MQEGWVNLSCPTCTKNWSASVQELPAPDSTYTCPACGDATGISELFDSSRDLEIYRSLTD